MIDLSDEETAAFLHSGCSLLVGTIDTDSRPHVSRGWAFTIVDAEAGLVRLLLESDDVPTLEAARAGRAIAVTGTNVATARSMQLKGRVVLVEAANAEDEIRHNEYLTDFMNDIHGADGYTIEIMEPAFRRCPVVACVVQLDVSFDQTPGPSAGVAIGQR